MAYGIGANDVANAFASSVGSRTLTMFQAIVLAAIFEFAGALLLGRGVTKTVKDGIVDADYFEDTPGILMYGMLCALAAAGTWLLVATALEMPVSTTHSIIGGIVGWGLVTGKDCVIWYDTDHSKDFPVKGITAVVISWVFSPVASGIVAAFFFWVTRFTILRHKNSYNRSFAAFPVLMLITIFINAFYVLDKGISKQADSLTTEKSAWIAAIVAGCCALITALLMPLLRKYQTAWLENHQKEADELAHAMDNAEATGGTTEGKKGDALSSPPAPSSFFDRVASAFNSKEPHSAIDAHQETRNIHDHAEVFDPATESVFRYLQVITACADSFAHGANDVANAVGPFAAIWGVYTHGGQLSSKVNTPVWILAIGGAGIVVGLATYGYHIIRAIGVKLIKITPSRGFALELGTSLVVVTGSYLGLPLSTTHCQVGATIAVGLLEGRKAVGWSVVLRSVIGWIITLIVTGIMSAVLMAQGIYSPNLNQAEALNECADTMGTANLDQIARMREANCQVAQTPSFSDNLFDTEWIVNSTTFENHRYPQRALQAFDYTNDLFNNATTISCPNSFEDAPSNLLELYPPEEGETVELD